MPIIGLPVRVAVPGATVSFPLFDHRARMASGGNPVTARWFSIVTERDALGPMLELALSRVYTFDAHKASTPYE